MSMVQSLIALANGVNPETGEILPESSVVHSAEAIRLLFTLAHELDSQPVKKPKKPKLSSEEKRQKNLAEGKPARSHFPWSEDEINQLIDSYRETPNIETVASKYERSPLAVATQLAKANIIAPEEVESYRPVQPSLQQTGKVDGVSQQKHSEQ